MPRAVFLAAFLAAGLIGCGGSSQPDGDSALLVPTCPTTELGLQPPCQAEEAVDLSQAAARAGFQPLAPAALPNGLELKQEARVVVSGGVAQQPRRAEIWLLVTAPGSTPLPPEGGRGAVEQGIQLQESDEPVTVAGAAATRERLGDYDVTFYQSANPGQRLVQFQHDGVWVTAMAFVGDTVTDESLREVIAAMRPLE